ncbi:MAG TPA: ABC transporter permease, partial [Tetragenococcus sp.]|nr:ABC transporter permease [Tetragenococcus sp.]
VISLSGALISQNDGYADVSKGIGVIVIGLASIIIGEVLYGELTFFERLVATVVGSIIYQLLILLVIRLGFDTTYLKLFSAIVLTMCLLIPQIKEKLQLKTGFESEADK